MEWKRRRKLHLQSVVQYKSWLFDLRALVGSAEFSLLKPSGSPRGNLDAGE